MNRSGRYYGGICPERQKSGIFWPFWALGAGDSFSWLANTAKTLPTSPLPTEEKRQPEKYSKKTDGNIIKKLTMEKEFIENKEIPIRHYNYSYIKGELRCKYHQKVSLPTIISRAKKHNSFRPRPERKAHDRGRS